MQLTALHFHVQNDIRSQKVNGRFVREEFQEFELRLYAHLSSRNQNFCVKIVQTSCDVITTTCIQRHHGYGLRKTNCEGRTACKPVSQLDYRK
jgi:hypothetical protein